MDYYFLYLKNTNSIIKISKDLIEIQTFWRKFSRYGILKNICFKKKKKKDVLVSLKWKIVALMWSILFKATIFPNSIVKNVLRLFYKRICIYFVIDNSISWFR